MSTCLEAALIYAGYSWRVIPVHSIQEDGRCTCERPDCGNSAGKHPRISDWPNAASTDPQTIREWFERWPDSNVGIATGAGSGFVVLDIDRDKGGYNSLGELERKHGRLPATIVSLTGGGGEHHLWQHPGRPVGNKVEIAPGLDIRGDGGLIVVEPSLHRSGQEYLWQPANHPSCTPLAPAPGWLLELATGAERDDGRGPAELMPDVIPEGERNARLTSLAGSLQRRGASAAAILAALEAENEQRCRPPLPLAEVQAIAVSIGRYPPAPLEPEHLTDLGNAHRLVRLSGHDLRHCDALGGWLCWDGRRWATDDIGRVARLAAESVRAMYMEASVTPDKGARKALARWALASESAGRLRAMVELASTQAEVAVRGGAFDTDPLLATCLNGTVDLRTGGLREHRREDLITQLIPVEYDPDARDPIFERYLEHITGGDAEFAAYLQRAAGYSLTGLTDEEDVFLILGPGGSGKSTLVEALLATWGDYGHKASFATFLARKGLIGEGDPPRADLLRMRGARLVAAAEPEKDRALAAATVKEMTGGDTVTARNPYARRSLSFQPTHKLWLAANEAPIMADDDSGLWRRLKRLPFEHVIPEHQQDPTVKKHLKGPGRAAILAWAVQGCLAWQQEGLWPPEVVRRRTAELRAEFDPLAEFLETRCRIARGTETLAAALRAAYEVWASEMGAKPIDNREWGKRLRALGCDSVIVRQEGRQLRAWRGIALV